MEQIIQVVALAALPVLFAITLHEAAHGYTARHFGDPTAYQAGRITLNPLRHIDPIGTVVVPLMILLVSSGDFLFGWAKPVPVDFGRLRNPKKDMLWVAAAGPLSNLAMACGWALMFKLSLAVPLGVYGDPLLKMSLIGISVNVVLLVLNLLPLPPLDGGRIAVSLLPMPLAVRFSQLERWGFPILLLLLFTDVLGKIMAPLVAVVRTLLAFVFQLPT
ncbi:MAG TPA: site-2 protease family protein [Rhodocyclaceae bacterium]|nr:site-2 protease family protein [Rhodocyclaceae bacterium]